MANTDKAQGEQAAGAAQGPKFILVRGRGPQAGKFRGVITSVAKEGATTSIYWGPQYQEIVLSEDALRECQEDGDINVMPLREMTAEEAAAHVQGPIAAQQGIDAAALSDDALEAEMRRRAQAKAQAAAAKAKKA